MIRLKLIKWGYTRRYQIKALFDTHPASPVILAQINRYYFVRQIYWDESDPIVGNVDLWKMEVLVNKELGLLEDYLNRRSLRR